MSVADGGETVDDRRPWVPTWPPPPKRTTGPYTKAPIVEAIIEVQIEGNNGLSVEDLEDFVSRLTDWPVGRTGRIVRSPVQGVTTDESEDQLVGYAFLRDDTARRIQVTPTSLGLGWIGPYQRWEDLVQEFWPVWRSFRSAVEPEMIVRLATRFVNVLQIPAESIEITDYLRTRADISPTLPQRLRAFFMQVDVPLNSDGNLGVLITSAMGEPVDADHTALVLDLDTYDATSIDLQRTSEKELTSRLATLREVKNYVFEASITDATRGLIR